MRLLLLTADICITECIPIVPNEVGKTAKSACGEGQFFGSRKIFLQSLRPK